MNEKKNTIKGLKFYMYVVFSLKCSWYAQTPKWSTSSVVTMVKPEVICVFKTKSWKLVEHSVLSLNDSLHHKWKLYMHEYLLLGNNVYYRTGKITQNALCVSSCGTSINVNVSCKENCAVVFKDFTEITEIQSIFFLYLSSLPADAFVSSTDSSVYLWTKARNVT